MLHGGFGEKWGCGARLGAALACELRYPYYVIKDEVSRGEAKRVRS